MKRAGKVLAFFCVGFLLLLVVGFLAFYHLVQIGEFRAFLAGEIERQTHFKVRLGDGNFEIGRIGGVGFRDVALTEPNGDAPALTAERVTARIALLPLLQRRFIVTEIRLQNPRVRLIRETHGKFPLLEQLLSLPFLKQEHDQFSLDLRAIKIVGGEVDFQDYYMAETPARTQLHDLSLDLKRLRGQFLRDFLQKLARKRSDSGAGALEFALTTTIERDRYKAKFDALGTMIFPSEKLEFDKVRWSAQTRLSAAPAPWVQALSGGRLRAKSLSGTLDSRLQIEGNPLERLHLKGDIKFKGLSVDAPDVFAALLTAEEGRLDVDMDWQPSRWEFSRFELTTHDLKLSARGGVRAAANGQTQIQLSALAPSLTVAALKKYLPLKWLVSPNLDSLMASLQQGEIEVKRFGLAASLGELQQTTLEGLGERFFFDAELRHFAANFDGGYLPLRGVQGRVAFEQGLWSFRNIKGNYGQSELEAVDGSYRPAPTGQGALEVRARGELELAELRDQLRIETVPAQAVKLAQSIHDLAGRAKFDFSLQRTPKETSQVEGKIVLDGARLRMDNYSLTDVKGDLTFTPQEIRVEKARAVLNGAQVLVRVAARNYAADNGVFDLRVESNEMKTGVITTLFQEKASLADPGTVRGWVRYQGPLASREGRRFTGNLDLDSVQLHLRPLLQPLRELHGTIKFDEAAIDFQNLKGLLAGTPASVNGRWRFGQKTPLFFDFSAPNLDLQNLRDQIDPEATEFYANLEAVGKISLARGRYKSFEFSDLKTDVVLDHRAWKLTRLSLNAGGGTLHGTATIVDKPDTVEFSIEPQMQSVPVGNLISWFEGGKADMTGKVNIAGQLNSIGKDSAERLRNLSGAFHMRIEDGTIRRLRVLVQILNLLDLSRWFTFQVPDIGKRGINFRSITADFKVNRGVYTTDNLIVDSDDLRMTGSGKIDSPKDEIDLVIAVRPFAGIDTGLNQIPLIGTGIAALKNSFLVASFNIKGSMDDPTITPAPLSTLSEMALGVLRIPKSMLTLPGGEKKEPANAPPP